MRRRRKGKVHGNHYRLKTKQSFKKATILCGLTKTYRETQHPTSYLQRNHRHHTAPSRTPFLMAPRTSPTRKALHSISSALPIPSSTLYQNFILSHAIRSIRPSVISSTSPLPYPLSIPEILSSSSFLNISNQNFQEPSTQISIPLPPELSTS